MPVKLLSLAGFYLSCLQVFFRPGQPRGRDLLWNLLSRSVIYFCNWCYFLFLNTAEYLWFRADKALWPSERLLAQIYRKPSQFWIALTEGVKITGPETLYRLTYGETSWFGIASSLRMVEAGPEDVFVDLGCGTGRNVFFAHARYGMRAIGIDLIPSFIHNAREVVKKLNLSGIEFRQINIFETDLRAATIVYVTANCLDQEWLARLIELLHTLPPGARVISTARAIPSPDLKLLYTQKQFFSWGMDTVYIHQREAA